MKKLRTIIFTLFLCGIVAGIGYCQEDPGSAYFGSAADRAAAVGKKKIIKEPVGGQEETLEEKDVLPEEKIEIEISRDVIDKEIPLYKTDLKQLVFEAEQKIKKIDEKLQAEEADKVAKESFDKGVALYKQGKYEDAKKELETALKSARLPATRGAIRSCIRRSELQIKQAKQREDAKAAQQRRLMERQQREAQRKAEREAACRQREMERKQREAQRQAELAQRKAAQEARRRQIAAEREARRKQLEIERQQREAQRQAIIAQRKAEREAACKQRELERQQREAARQAELQRRKMEREEKRKRLQAEREAKNRAMEAKRAQEEQK